MAIRLRRLSQILCLALFLFLLFRTEFRGSLRAVQGEIRLAYPVRLFLETDPLVAISNVLATGALYRGLLWSLIVLIPTFFLGRFYCGWICPLGTLHHFCGSLKSERKRGRRLLESNRYQRWQILKYYLLAAVLASALFGSAIAGILDPISLAVRSLALSILPSLNYALNSVLDAFSGSSWRGIRLFGEGLGYVFKQTVLSFKQPYFRQSFLLGILFLALLLLNTRITRFWCRALCPLGALLGLFSRWSLIGLEKSHGDCRDCQRCLLHCQGGDDPIPGVPWRKAECHLCMNCVADCPEARLKFSFVARSAETVVNPDLKRRHVFTGLAAGVVALPLLRSNAGFAVERHERSIRPPGALEEREFLSRCIRCGECMKVCPNNALHPSVSEAGVEGLWTPVVAPRIGYCESTCTLCGQVCPTGAIWSFSEKEKGWVPDPQAGSPRPIRIGTAFIDRGRCLPWAMATECIVCEEWCPTSPKAIYLNAVEVTGAAASTRIVRQPRIDPERCVGCGACEFACPVQDRPAVYVTSIGESRSGSNQFLLRRGPGSAPRPILPVTNEVPGWTQARLRVFEAADLWKYVDGDAERYLQAGVQRTFTADYKYSDGFEAVADVHRMRDSSAARLLMESESSSGSRPIELGDAGRMYGQSLTFRRATYFVRVVAYESGRQVEDRLLTLARGIDRRLR
jgi:polyferredoxin